MPKKTKSAKTATATCVHGDCVETMQEQLASGVVNLAFADPPYNIGWSGYDKYSDKRRSDEYLAWCQEWISVIHRKLHRHGSFWLAIADEYASELDVLCKKIGFHRRSWVIWYYTFGVACPKNFSRSHTHLFYYTKSKSQYTFNHEEPTVRVPSARQLKYNDKRGNPKGKMPDNLWVLHPDELAKCFGGDSDTWLQSRICGTFREREHRGTYGEEKTCPQMPLPILDRIITACSNPGDLVIDPFLGTGTTAESAVRLGRDFWGSDISKTYVAKCRKRAARVLV